MTTLTKKQKELLEYVTSADEKGIPRIEAFSIYAQKYNLKTETVRNNFYFIIKRYNLLNEINVSKIHYFDKKELIQQMLQVVDFLNNGCSVRSACLKVANNDAKVMLRLQNKFRTLEKNNLDFLLELGYKKNISKKTNKNSHNFNLFASNKMSKSDSMLLKNDSIVSKNVQCSAKNGSDTAKVLKMPKNNVLTDADINNLFLGLVKMVKRQALENAPKILKQEIELANNSLKEAITKLGINTRKMEIVKSENYELKKKLKESEQMLKDIKQTHLQLLNEINHIGKLDELKIFLENYKSRLCSNSNEKSKLD